MSWVNTVVSPLMNDNTGNIYPIYSHYISWRVAGVGNTIIIFLISEPQYTNKSLSSLKTEFNRKNSRAFVYNLSPHAMFEVSIGMIHRMTNLISKFL